MGHPVLTSYLYLLSVLCIISYCQPELVMEVISNPNYRLFG